MGSKGLFHSDLNSEQILAGYLDGVYEKLGYEFTRPDGLDSQHRGIDVVITRKGKERNCDEKAQLHYLNKELPTFAFEISYLKDGERREGWLFDETKETQFYMLVTCIHLKSGKDKLEKATDIAGCKVTVVNRGKLIDLLHSKGITQASCKEFEAEAREKGQNGKQIHKGLSGMSFHLSLGLVEQPFNLVISRQLWEGNGIGKMIHHS